MSPITRRRFLERASASRFFPGVFRAASRRPGSRNVFADPRSEPLSKQARRFPAGIPGDPLKSIATEPLGERFADLPRRFGFKFLPWSTRSLASLERSGSPPPADLATEYFPLLGAYDSRSTTVIERHARWIAESGAGAMAARGREPGNFEDLLVHDVMDVMKDHGIAVTFGLEPYVVDRGHHYASDILYLLTTYGERRGWDAFLVLKNPDGSETPVLKGFRCILPATIVDCHGAIRAIPDYTPDNVWARQY